MLYSKVPLSRYAWQLGNLSAVVCYCFDSQKNVKWSDVLNLRDKLKRFAPFINGTKTYPTILELPRSMASARVMDWWLSRNAVLDVLKEASIQNFNADSLAISVSHTPNASVAILSADGSAVGIDIERSSREIHDRVVERIKHKKDIRISERLDYWIIKEAVLKASGASALHDVVIIDKVNSFEYLASVTGRSFRVVLGAVPWGYRLAIATESLIE